MKIRQYTKEYRAECIEIFDSNIGQYFSPSERDEFSQYLDSLDDQSAYYVCLIDGLVRACGGIGLNAATAAALTWGMVHRDFHGKGIGTGLTDYRLSKIRENTEVDRVEIVTSQHTEGFYRKRGFVVKESVPNGFGKGIDCIAMELDMRR